MRHAAAEKTEYLLYLGKFGWILLHFTHRPWQKQEISVVGSVKRTTLKTHEKLGIRYNHHHYYYICDKKEKKERKFFQLESSKEVERKKGVRLRILNFCSL